MAGGCSSDASVSREETAVIETDDFFSGTQRVFRVALRRRSLCVGRNVVNAGNALRGEVRSYCTRAAPAARRTARRRVDAEGGVPLHPAKDAAAKKAPKRKSRPRRQARTYRTIHDPPQEGRMSSAGFAGQGIIPRQGARRFSTCTQRRRYSAWSGVGVACGRGLADAGRHDVDARGTRDRTRRATLNARRDRVKSRPSRVRARGTAACRNVIGMPLIVACSSPTRRRSD